MGNVLTPVFRVSFPNVFEAKKNDLNGKDEFSVLALFAKGTDLAKLRAAAKEAIIEKWGADQKKWPKNMRSPFRSMDEKAEVDEVTGKKAYPPGMEEGGIFMNLKSKQKPGVVNEKVEDIISESEFYPGCYARATVRCYAYEMKGNCGVAFGLQNIQKTKDGDALGSRTKAQDDFAPIENAEGEAVGGEADATSLF